MRALYLIIIWMLLFGWPLPAQAYSVENHQMLSEEAYKVFKRCLNQTDRPDSSLEGTVWQEMPETLKDMQPIEDYGEFPIGKVRRLTNWHFYFPGRKPILGLLDKSLNRRFGDLADRLEEAIEELENDKSADKSKTIRGLAGRLAHYFQDMTVPPHVAPNLHGTPMTGGDPFDKVKAIVKAADPYFNTNDYCKTLLAETTEDLTVLLEQTARETVASLATGFDVKTEEGRSLRLSARDFWQNDPKTCMAFEPYGKYGASFGEKVIRDETDDTTFTLKTVATSGVDEEEVLEFRKYANERHRQAVEATVHALFYLHGRLTDAIPHPWERLSKHVIPTSKKGLFFPLPTTQQEMEENHPPPKICGFNELERHLDEIEENILKSGVKKILVFVHGGLNNRKTTFKLALSQYHHILKDGYYPIFLNWRSGMFETYGEHLFQIRDGKRQTGLAVVTSPLYLAKDLGASVVEAPIHWGHQGMLWASTVLNPRDVDGEVSQCAENKPMKPFKGVNACFNRDSLSDGGRILDALKFAAQSPFKVVLTPLTASLGKSAWDNMLRRTRTLFNSDPEFDPEDACHLEAMKHPRGSGVGAVFFKRLVNIQKTNKMDLTLIGHSMGTIVLNRALSKYPQLEVRNIVYMAAADSIRTTHAAVGGYLEENPTTRFFNLSLHPDADAREASGMGFAPSGSLLEWIDDMYDDPLTPIDRTMGKWDNVKDALHLFDETGIGDRVHLRVFGHGKCDPTTHGAFNDTHMSYWRENFWWPKKKATSLP